MDLGVAAQALADAHWVYFAWLALWITLDCLVISYKKRLLVVCRGLDLRHLDALRAYYVASFAGCFLPSTVGADAMCVAAISGPGRTSAEAAASALVVVEHALGFVAAAYAALLSLGLLAGLALDLPSGVRAWSLAILGGCGGTPSPVVHPHAGLGQRFRHGGGAVRGLLRLGRA